MNGWQLCRRKCIFDEQGSEKGGQSGSNWKEGYSCVHCLQPRWAEKHIRMHNTNLETNKLKITSNSTAATGERDSDVTWAQTQRNRTVKDKKNCHLFYYLLFST